MKLPSLQKRSTAQSVVGIDFDASGVAATEVFQNGVVNVMGAGVGEVPPGAVHDGEVSDPAALARAFADLIGSNGLGKTVRLGLANQKIAVRTLLLPVIEDERELETAVRFQAAEEIPMPLDQAVLDYAVVGRTGPEEERRMEVVVTAARRDMVFAALEAVRGAGLRPVGIDLSAYGLIRALHREVAAPGAPSYEARITDNDGGPLDARPARLYSHLGDITNLAVARGDACLFTRAATFGVEGIAQRLAERESISIGEARAKLVATGISAAVPAAPAPAQMGTVPSATPMGTVPIDAEGAVEPEATGTVPAEVAPSPVEEALAEGIPRIADELRLSLDYYGQLPGMPPVSDVVISGPGAAIPGMAEALAATLSLPVEVGRVRELESRYAGDASRLALSFGLGLNS